MSDRTAYPQLMPRLLPHDIHDLVATQVRVANYLARPLPLPSGSDRVYTDNAELWAAVLSEQLRAQVTVRLENFLLFEWLPRSPGLFYTHEANDARASARSNLIQEPRGGRPSPSGSAGQGDDHRRVGPSGASRLDPATRPAGRVRRPRNPAGAAGRRLRGRYALAGLTSQPGRVAMLRLARRHDLQPCSVSRGRRSLGAASIRPTRFRCTATAAIAFPAFPVQATRPSGTALCSPD